MILNIFSKSSPPEPDNVVLCCSSKTRMQSELQGQSSLSLLFVSMIFFF